MSLQWTVIATFLYAEIGMVILLMIPFISVQRWRKIFKSRLLSYVESHAYIYYWSVCVFQFIMMLDAIREMRKYGGAEHELHDQPLAETNMHMKLFRAQRNFYISGFALFLFLVLKRLVTLITAQAMLAASHDAALKQAKNASETAEKLMKAANEKSDENESNEKDEEQKKLISKLKEDLNKARQDTLIAEKDRSAMKQQAASVSAEYDRLMQEHEKTQHELQAVQGASTSKKEE
ncbi:PREDICTED: B-cell receptor-associated protein 31-like [Priapulus caudatus]|uniref:Endoplasmic reticulum transmembrane protein n=1 Tax=Priapulus caudatus TaxID=37621 RepID=A0ABM1EUY0_PRICU|nr:PREDICTED: B-cell receptor-associated protein 31-like [Priapulus caudatus]